MLTAEQDLSSPWDWDRQGMRWWSWSGGEREGGGVTGSRIPAGSIASADMGRPDQVMEAGWTRRGLGEGMWGSDPKPVPPLLWASVSPPENGINNGTKPKDAVRLNESPRVRHSQHAWLWEHAMNAGDCHPYMFGCGHPPYLRPPRRAI